jgi:riboflavin synthase
MFTGIITDIGSVKAISGEGDVRFDINTAFVMDDVAIGASIACAGVCLTVIEKDEGWFAVQASDETLQKTTLGDWQADTKINLERALKLGDELGGHIVSGHVDGIAHVVSTQAIGDSMKIDFEAPRDLAAFIAQKGSATIDGVSLTVNDVDDCLFSVNIIPHTQSETTLGQLIKGDRVNLEIDVLARYVARLNSMNG